MKALMILMLIAVLGALASAGVFMLRRGQQAGNGRNKAMARALALRVALSVLLFLFILLGWYMGWVRPTGIPAGA
ncbi:MAG: DUF2909 domain-containing protein [Chitinophagaceae bacterium]|nr:DUF2909 domain-containing protein [Rubrivivax sp.]